MTPVGFFVGEVVRFFVGDVVGFFVGYVVGFFVRIRCRRHGRVLRRGGSGVLRR